MERPSKCVGGGITQKLLDRIQALEDELRSVKDELALSGIDLEALKESRATPSAYGLAKISELTSVTETSAGLVLSAKEKNPGISGTLANLISQNKTKTSQNKSSIESINHSMFRMVEYRKFSDIPLTNYLFGFFIINYNGIDNDAPIKTEGSHWWNVIQFGIGTRMTQIAFSVFRERHKIYIRQKHDSTWVGWYALAGMETK